MSNQPFVDSLLKEIVQPGVERLMATRYFSELREGKLSGQTLKDRGDGFEVLFLEPNGEAEFFG